MERIVVVGGSLAGVEAAAALRREGYGGELTLVGGEPGEPYERYPLSKDFLTENLAGDQLGLESCVDADVRVLTAAEAVALDPRNGRVTLRGGVDLAFDGLVIATGSRPRRLAWSAGPAGICYLRTLDEALIIREALDRGPGHVVVVGGGLIGSELASAATRRGIAVTIVDRSDAPLARTLGPCVASHLLESHAGSGVRVLAGRQVAGVGVRSGHVRSLRLDSGEVLTTDLVIIAAGSVPNVEWLGSSGLDTAAGVLCRPTLHAVGATSIVAAGDVARTSYGLLDGDAVRVEHWRNAIEQARCAAKNLLSGPGASRCFDATPCFSTTVQGVHVRVTGFPQYGDEERVVLGSTDAASYVVALGRRRRLVAVLAVNTPDHAIAEHAALVDASARGHVDIRDLKST